MHPSVPERWRDFSEDIEGRLPFPYLCTAARVTTGVGNMIEPLAFAQTLPWLNTETGRRATPDEVAAAYRAVEARKDLAPHGGGRFRNVTALRLTDADIDRLVWHKLGDVERALRGMFPAWDGWPADAQLALLSWAWAVGVHSPYPRMFAALRAGDFRAAAEECTINPQRGTIRLRNERNRMLLRNAARVVESGGVLEFVRLYWPRDLDAAAAETQPELPNVPSDPRLEAELPRLVPDDEPPESPRIHRLEELRVIVRPRVPLGRPALDGELPDSDRDDEA